MAQPGPTLRARTYQVIVPERVLLAVHAHSDPCTYVQPTLDGHTTRVDVDAASGDSGESIAAHREH